MKQILFQTGIMNTICLIADVAAIIYLPFSRRYNANDKVSHQMFTILIMLCRPLYSFLLYKEKMAIENPANPDTTTDGSLEQNMINYSEIDFSARHKTSDLVNIHRSSQLNNSRVITY